MVVQHLTERTRRLMHLRCKAAVCTVLGGQVADKVDVDLLTLLGPFDLRVLANSTTKVRQNELLKFGVKTAAFPRTKSDWRAGDVFAVFAEGGVLGQHQRTNLNYFVGAQHWAHCVAIVEVAVAKWVHADLCPSRVFNSSISPNLCGLVADRFPLTKHGGNCALACPLRNLGRRLLIHAKSYVGHCCHRFVADDSACVIRCLHFTVGGLGCVNANHPRVMLLVRRNVQAQLGKVAFGQGV